MSRLDLSLFSRITTAALADGVDGVDGVDGADAADPAEALGPPDPAALHPNAPWHSALAASVPMDSLIGELRAYQAELEAQNKVLRYSQAAAESASERFETLFSSVPLALMVVGEHDMVVQANSMAHRSFQPTERDRPLTALMPFVRAQDARRVREAFALAQL